MLPSHTRYDHSSIGNRKDYSWPGGKRLAFYVALNVEHFAFLQWARNGSDQSRRPALDPQLCVARLWKPHRHLAAIPDAGRIKAAGVDLLNSEVARLYPDIVAKIKERGDDVLGHGRTNAETLGNPQWELDEKRMIADCTEIIEKHVGVRPTGWMGPGAVESKVSPDLLKEAGYTHLLDWPIDDQPLWMRTRTKPILSIPYPLELNDAGALIARDHTGREFADMLVDQFEEMLEQSDANPLVFCASLHGFIVGQPFRLRPLRKAMKHCVEHKQKDKVWFTRAGEIADYCFKLPPGTILGS